MELPKPPLKALPVLFALLYICCINARSQTLTNPWIFDNSILYPWQTIIDNNAVNCDMVQCPNFSHPSNTYRELIAVVWDNNPGTGWETNLQVRFNISGGALPIETIPQASYPDVVIGDDLNNPGNAYIITVIYRDESVVTTDIRINTYGLDLTNGPPYSLNLLGSTLISNGTDNSEFPHIDLFSDVNTLVGTSPNQLPMLNEYVATWNYDYGSSYEVMGAMGDINSVIPSQTFSVCTTGISPDVAAYTDSNGDKFAAFTYGGNPGEVSEFDLTTSPPSLVGTTYSFTGVNKNYGFRIEAMNQYDGTNAKWLAVANNANNDIVYMSDLNSMNDCSSNLANTTPSPAGIGPYKRPIVAAGVGGYGNGNLIGNSQYTTGWYEAQAVDIYSQDMQVATGLPANSGNYWKVNNSALSSTGSSTASSLAMSNSSNSGWGLLNVWFDGSNIKWKITSRNANVYDFKPTSAIDLQTDKISIYPNPAKNVLFVTNSVGNHYTITNVVGYKVLDGTIKSAGIIEITDLPDGIYFLQLDDTKNKHTIRFIKQY